MLEQIKKIAMEKYASEAEFNAFMEGFEKEASAERVLAELFSRRNLVKPLGALAVGIAGAVIAKGATSTYSAIQNNSLRSKFESSLTQAISSNRIIRSADPVKVKQYAETIFKFAPHVASDPNLLNFTLANIVQGESGIDLVTMKTLTDLEGRYNDNNSAKPIMGIKG